MREYEEYVKDFIKDELQNNSGRTVYGCDLGYAITEGINVDGSATYSTEKAKQYIKHWWDEAAEVYEYQKENYGECLQNPFEEPEKFHVCMIIEGVNSLFGQCDTVEKFWNDEFELTQEVINKIIEEVDEKEIKF